MKALCILKTVDQSADEFVRYRMDERRGWIFILSGAEGVGRNSQVKGMDSDDTLENNILVVPKK